MLNLGSIALAEAIMWINSESLMYSIDENGKFPRIKLITLFENEVILVFLNGNPIGLLLKILEKYYYIIPFK